MSVYKNGIWKHSGSPNPNLLKGTHFTLIQTANGGSNKAFDIPDLSMLTAGTKVAVSVDIEVYNVASWSRIGIEPSFSMSDGGSTQYIGAWTNDKTNRKIRLWATATLRANATGYGQHAVYIQGVTFGEGGGYIKLSNPKLEIGDVATAWVPHINDSEYVNNNIHGFIEKEEKAKIQKNDYIEANSFIEM